MGYEKSVAGALRKQKTILKTISHFCKKIETTKILNDNEFFF